MDALDQAGLDHRMIELDGTREQEESRRERDPGRFAGRRPRRRRALRPAAVSLFGRPGSAILPAPLMNIINGGAHADNEVDVQEFMLMPLGFDSFHEALRAGVETFHQLKKVLKGKKLNTSVGDEGGFAPDLKSNAEAIDLIVEAIQQAGLQAGPANRHRPRRRRHGVLRRKKKTYNVDGREIDSAAMVDLLAGWVEKYPICSVEDGCSEDDWDGWKLLSERLGNRVQLVGDDMFVTNTKRLQRGIDDGIANSILIKVNQIGTLTETIEAMQLAARNGYTNVMSHRSGETEDSTIADLAVALGTGQIKDRLGLADRSHGEVQSIAADRGRPCGGRGLRRSAV